MNCKVYCKTQHFHDSNLLQTVPSTTHFWLHKLTRILPSRIRGGYKLKNSENYEEEQGLFSLMWVVVIKTIPNYILHKICAKQPSNP